MLTKLNVPLKIPAMQSKDGSPNSKRASRTKASPTASVTLRVRRDHLAQLDKIAAAKGTVRAAQIQTAIAEFIEQNH
jgi:hypothetical protein